jgi:hypothetical protein
MGSAEMGVSMDELAVFQPPPAPQAPEDKFAGSVDELGFDAEAKPAPPLAASEAETVPLGLSAGPPGEAPPAEPAEPAEDPRVDPLQSGKRQRLVAPATKRLTTPAAKKSNTMFVVLVVLGVLVVVGGLAAVVLFVVLKHN